MVTSLRGNPEVVWFSNCGMLDHVVV